MATRDMLVKDYAEFHSPADPLRQRDGRQAVADAAVQMLKGELAPEEMARLPWTDVTFCSHVRAQLIRYQDELQKHRVRFKALREVFGPGDK